MASGAQSLRRRSSSAPVLQGQLPLEHPQNQDAINPEDLKMIEIFRSRITNEGEQRVKTDIDPENKKIVNVQVSLYRFLKNFQTNCLDLDQRSARLAKLYDDNNENQNDNNENQNLIALYNSDVITKAIVNFNLSLLVVEVKGEDGEPNETIEVPLDNKIQGWKQLHEASVAAKMIKHLSSYNTNDATSPSSGYTPFQYNADFFGKKVFDLNEKPDNTKEEKSIREALQKFYETQFTTKKYLAAQRWEKIQAVKNKLINKLKEIKDEQPPPSDAQQKILEKIIAQWESLHEVELQLALYYHEEETNVTNQIAHVKKVYESLEGVAKSAKKGQDLEAYEKAYLLQIIALSETQYRLPMHHLSQIHLDSNYIFRDAVCEKALLKMAKEIIVDENSEVDDQYDETMKGFLRSYFTAQGLSQAFIDRVFNENPTIIDDGEDFDFDNDEGEGVDLDAPSHIEEVDDDE